jgi:type III secretion protein U
MSEKTEQPTSKRLRDAREKGQVCKSQEVGATVVLLSVFGIFMAAGTFFWETLLGMFDAPMRVMNRPFVFALPDVTGEVASMGGLIVFVTLGTAIVAGLAANLLQIRVLISEKAALPKLDK